MESVSVSGEVGGAGGAYSYEALKRLDKLWSSICSSQEGSCRSMILIPFRKLENFMCSVISVCIHCSCARASASCLYHPGLVWLI